MTAIDDATTAAAAYLKASENVVQAYRAMTVSHRTALATDFPTLNTGLQMLVNAHRPLDPPPK
jgi:hypothetical protein